MGWRIVDKHRLIHNKVQGVHTIIVNPQDMEPNGDYVGGRHFQVFMTLRGPGLNAYIEVIIFNKRLYEAQ